MPTPASHEFDVTMEVPALPGQAAVELVFATWAPGSYMVRDFARHIYDLTFTDGRGRPLLAQRLDKQRWRVETGGRAMRARYRVFAFEQSVRTSFLDDRHGFWNGTSLFFFVEGQLGRPCVVKVKAPPGWRVSTALEKTAGGYHADGFDAVADAPFEVGTHDLYRWRVGKVAFEVALYGRTNADVPRLLRDLRKIVAAAGALFSGFPFYRYLFIIHALPNRGGGLEHAASTTLDIAGMAFEDEAGYQSFAELAAHEFFHAWNVKRIRDRVLGPFDYTQENYTRLLWFHEGFTEYMESIVLLRAGLLSVKKYLQDLAGEWPRYASRPGRNVTPLSELSFEAWIKQYRPADNHTNRMVSYYEKGKWAAVVLELLLRRATAGRRGVEDLFVRLWRRQAKSAVGITVQDIRAAADATAGRSLAFYFDRYIDGCDELPVPALLRQAGLVVDQSAPWQDEDDDGTRRRRLRPWSGLSFAPATPIPGGDRAVVRNVVPNSPADRAGLSFGDEIVAVDGYRVNAATVMRRLADGAPGQGVAITFFRIESLRTVDLVLGENPERRLGLSIDAKATGIRRAIRRGWLGA